MNLPKLYQILAFSLFLTACDQSVKQDTLTVYTSRQPQLIEPILDNISGLFFSNFFPNGKAGRTARALTSFS